MRGATCSEETREVSTHIYIKYPGFLQHGWGVWVIREIFFIIIMDAEWRREKLEVLLEKVDRGRVNGLGCDFYDINLATNIRRRGVNHGPVYGRVKVTLPDGSKKVLLAHRLMYMLHTNTLHIPHDIHISHICHNSLCINPLHLSAEPPDVNNNRQLCKNMVPKVCLKHPGFPDCLF